MHSEEYQRIAIRIASSWVWSEIGNDNRVWEGHGGTSAEVSAIGLRPAFRYSKTGEIFFNPLLPVHLPSAVPKKYWAEIDGDGDFKRFVSGIEQGFVFPEEPDTFYTRAEAAKLLEEHRSLVTAGKKRPDAVLDLIAQARQEYGSLLFGGNCGQFAYALGKFLGDRHGKVEIAMLSETGIEEEDIRDGDADIYHVFLQVGNRFYDGSGKIDRSYLSKFAEAEYGSDASLWQGFPIDEATRRVISYQTAWDIEWVDFYRFFENIIS